MKKIIYIFVSLLVMSCVRNTDTEKFDLQGHRGARGLMPENTIPAFLKALEYGVTTLELDLAVSKDSLLVVSHEPYFSSEICLTSEGEPIADTAQYTFNLHQMTYAEIKAFDCGSKGHPRFPEQQKMNVAKPLLREVIDTVRSYLTNNGMQAVHYNIEIKSTPEMDNRFHPTPGVFGELVYEFLDGTIPIDQFTIQSFDFRVLQYLHKSHPDIRLALLIENELSPEVNLDSLGFLPNIYSCYYPMLTKERIKYLHAHGIKVIPWTVNETKEMKRLIEWGVDGLITDYPNRFSWDWISRAAL